MVCLPIVNMRHFIRISFPDPTGIFFSSGITLTPILKSTLCSIGSTGKLLTTPHLYEQHHRSLQEKNTRNCTGCQDRFYEFTGVKISRFSFFMSVVHTIKGIFSDSKLLTGICSNIIFEPFQLKISQND